MVNPVMIIFNSAFSNKVSVKWLIVITTIAFFAGALVYKFDLHSKILSGGYHSDKNDFYFSAPRQGRSEIFNKNDVEHPYTFIVYGDSRGPTSGIEKELIINRIISENPSFVIHLGDLVRLGNSYHWKIFDLFEGEIIKKGIPFYPILGNHDYKTKKNTNSNNTKDRLSHYFKRFNLLDQKRWYSFQYGNSSFIMLDTNSDYTSGSNQYNWLIDRLKEETEGFLFVFSHHPPHSKSPVHQVRESEKMLGNIFERSKKNGYMKPDFVFSGHVHNYERYKHNKINYIVSGGGGSKPHFIQRNKNDLYRKPGDNYHYCKVTVSEKKVLFEMIRLENNSGKWKVSDSFKYKK